MGQIAPEMEHRHLVRADLLERARRAGAEDPGLEREVRSALEGLAAAPVEAVVCTCSTIGGPAEGCADGVGVPVMRVDGPMAEMAVRGGGRIAVVAALQSTIAPTCELLAGAAASAGVRVEIVQAPCQHAWAAFEEGDLGRYVRLVAEHVDGLDAAVETVVLAQASMAPAAELTRGPRPVLSSPRSGVEAALRLMAGSPTTPARSARSPAA